MNRTITRRGLFGLFAVPALAALPVASLAAPIAEDASVKRWTMRFAPPGRKPITIQVVAVDGDAPENEHFSSDGYGWNGVDDGHNMVVVRIVP